MEQNGAQPPNITVRPERAEAVFATGLVAYKPGNMVWLDFFVQAEPATPELGRAAIVARIVVHPETLDDTIAKLSALRDSESR
jgi:hypothetical protein